MVCFCESQIHNFLNSSTVNIFSKECLCAYLRNLINKCTQYKSLFTLKDYSIQNIISKTFGHTSAFDRMVPIYINTVIACNHILLLMQEKDVEQKRKEMAQIRKNIPCFQHASARKDVPSNSHLPKEREFMICSGT